MQEKRRVPTWDDDYLHNPVFVEIQEKNYELILDGKLEAATMKLLQGSQKCSL